MNAALSSGFSPLLSFLNPVNIKAGSLGFSLNNKAVTLCKLSYTPAYFSLSILSNAFLINVFLATFISTCLSKQTLRSLVTCATDKLSVSVI